MEDLNLIIIILSLASAVLAWVAKLKWSKEFTLAKDAQIDALKEQVQAKKSELGALKGQLETKNELIRVKQSQIDHLNNLNPATLTEYHNKVTKGLEAFIEELKGELHSTKNLLDEKDSQLNSASKTSDSNQIRVKQLINERETLANQIETLQKQIDEQTDTLETNELIGGSTMWKTLTKLMFDSNMMYIDGDSRHQSAPRYQSPVIFPLDILKQLKNQTNFLWSGLAEIKSPSDILEEEILEKTYTNIEQSLKRLQNSGYLNFSMKFSQRQTENGEAVHKVKIEDISTILINLIRRIESGQEDILNS